MSYSNQWDHKELNRFLIRDTLLAWAHGTAANTSPTTESRNGHIDRLLKLTDSELERRWLRLVDAHGLRLPSEAQVW